MRVPWISVHGKLSDKPVVHRLAPLCRGDVQKAVGVLVDFWGNVAEHATNGVVAHYPDEQLERWARWTGKRGAFAAWLRAVHLDADGRVNEWDDYAGALEIRRQTERERLTNKRNLLRNNTPTNGEVLRNTGELLQPAHANGTERYGTGEETRSRAGRASAPPPEWVREVTECWRQKIGHVEPRTVQKLLGTIQAAEGTAAIIGAIGVYADPDEGPPIGKPRAMNWFAQDFQRYHQIDVTPMTLPNGDPSARAKRLMREPA